MKNDDKSASESSTEKSRLKVTTGLRAGDLLRGNNTDSGKGGRY